MAKKGGDEFAKRIGCGRGLVGFRHGEETLAFNRAANNPIIRNFDTAETVRRDLLENGRLIAGRSRAGDGR